ncbi:MAG: CapA family protein [Dehalococcoidia bacterium]
MRTGRRAFLFTAFSALAGVPLACASERVDVRIQPAGAPSVAPASEQTGLASATPSRPPVEAGIRVGAVGDLMLARDITTLMQQHGAGYPFERVRPLIEGVDYLIGNMEGTFTTRGSPLAKTYTFRTPPELAAGLADAGFGLVTLGNNHAADFGAVSLDDTLSTLDRVGVASVGAGAEERSARAPYVVDVGGQRLGVLSYCGVGESVFAGAGAGVALADPEIVHEDANRVAPDVDHLLVFMHAGTEYVRQPTTLQRDVAHAAIEAGAAAVIGSHPHVLQGVEWYRERPILYSLGNFVFDLDPDDLATLGSAPFETAVAVLTLRPGARPALEFRPAFIDPLENRPRPATDEEASRVLEALGEIRG